MMRTTHRFLQDLSAKLNAHDQQTESTREGNHACPIASVSLTHSGCIMLEIPNAYIHTYIDQSCTVINTKVLFVVALPARVFAVTQMAGKRALLMAAATASCAAAACCQRRLSSNRSFLLTVLVNGHLASRCKLPKLVAHHVF